MTDLLPLIDRDAEQALIGAVFHNNALAVTLDLAPEDFTDPVHQRLWAYAQATVKRGGSVGMGPIVKQAPELERYLRSVVDAGVLHRDVSGHAQRVGELSGRRRMREAALEFVEQISDLESHPDDTAASLIGEVSRSMASRAARGKAAVAAAVVELLKKPATHFSTGLPSLDSAIGGGLFSGKCYGIAARKKVGKTVMLGTVSHNLSRRQIPHLFVALEMSPEEIEQRNMARDIGINSVQFLKGVNSGLAAKAAEYALAASPKTIYEHAPGTSLDHLRRMVTSAVVNHKITGFVLDYWQLVGGKAKNETEEYHLRTVAQWVADICRKENLWAIVAAQVNQDGNTRGGEGMKLACDVYFTLHREKDDDRAWLEMEESRYVTYASVGSEMQPGLLLNKHGPYFEDVASVREPPTYDRTTGEVLA